MVTILLGTALAQTPDIPIDEPSSRTFDWPRVHDRSIATAHSGQVWGLAAITAWAVGWGLGYMYIGGEWGGFGTVPHSAAVGLVGGGGGVMVVATAVVAGSSLRARHALVELGKPELSPGPGYVAWGCAGASAGLFIAWGATEASGRPASPALPLFAGLAGIGAWTAGTIQVALDHQAKADLDLHPTAQLYLYPGRLVVVF